MFCHFALFTVSSGTAVTLYGTTRNSGGSFTFSVNDGPSRACSSWRNDTNWAWQQELCASSGLGGTASHTLTITNTDFHEGMLCIDFLE